MVNNGIDNNNSGDIDATSKEGALNVLDGLADGILGEYVDLNPDHIKDEPKGDEPTFTEKQKAILAANEGAVGFDKDGNLLGANNRVLKTKDQLNQKVDDGKDDAKEETVLMDDAGNIIDEEGNIKIEAKDVKRDAAGNVILPTGEEKTIIGYVSDYLKTNFGVPFTKEELALEDTEENVAKLALKAGKFESENVIKEWMETNPKVLQYYNHLAAGGNDETFFSVNSQWRGAKLPADDAEGETARAVRRNIIEQNFLQSFGYNQATTDEERLEIKQQATEQAQLVIDAGKEVEQAKSALKSLQRSEAKREQEIVAKDTAILKQREAEREKYWNDVKGTIDSGKLEQFSIPEQDKPAFFEYLSKDVTGKGQSKSMLDDSKLTLARNLEWEYMKFKGFNLDKLIKLQAATSNIQNLREKAKGKAVKVVRATPQNNVKLSHEPGILNDISMDSFSN